MGSTAAAFTRAFDNALKKDPRWLVIRRIKFADKVRSLIYGVEKQRPFGRVLRT